MLDHIKDNHKDVSALIRLQKYLSVCMKALFLVEVHDYLAYHQILGVYNLDDLESLKGDGLHKAHFHSARRRYVQ